MENKIQVPCINCTNKLLDVDFGGSPIIQERLIVIKCDGWTTYYKVSLKIEKQTSQENISPEVPEAKIEINTNDVINAIPIAMYKRF